MFRFEHPDHLYALALLPVLALFFVAVQAAQRRAIRRFGSSHLMARLMPERSRYKHTFKFLLLLAGLFFLIIGWSNPQWGTRREQVKRRSADVFIALDISQSMMAEDVPPNRLERAKRFAENLVEALRGERLGLILFAGNAYLQVPLTSDYAAVILFLKSANPDMAASQGTAIGDAIDLAERSFEPESKNHRALILLTDGEDFDDGTMQRATTARENGLLLFTIGVGTEEGSFIPVTIGGRQDYKRDPTGNPVRSRLEEGILRQLARTGDGAYFNLASGSEQVLPALRQRIDAIEKREYEQRLFSEHQSYFQYFVGLGLLLITLEFLISYRKSRLRGRGDLFDVP